MLRPGPFDLPPDEEGDQFHQRDHGLGPSPNPLPEDQEDAFRDPLPEDRDRGDAGRADRRGLPPGAVPGSTLSFFQERPPEDGRFTHRHIGIRNGKLPGSLPAEAYENAFMTRAAGGVRR